jgi:hypothetical protein
VEAATSGSDQACQTTLIRAVENSLLICHISMLQARQATPRTGLGHHKQPHMPFLATLELDSNTSSPRQRWQVISSRRADDSGGHENATR